MLMRKIALLLLVSLLGLTAAVAQDLSLYQSKLYVSATGDSLPYRILYPENYDPHQRYPLILFLHGAGERGSDNQAQLTHGAKQFLDPSNRQKFPAIILFPQCPANSYWSSVTINRNQQPLGLAFNYQNPMTPPLRSALELTRSIMATEAVDPKRVYITGLSMGGMGTFEAVFHEPKLFAAAAPICGGGDAAAYTRKTAKVPFWVFHGDADAVVNVQGSRDMVARLKQLKGKVKYTEYPGVNHNSWDNAFAEPDFLPWIFAQHKK